MLKYPLCLQPPKLPMNFVQRPEHLDVIVSKLCNTTSNLNAHSKVIAVIGVGGFGKTTLVTGLCYDPRIKRQFTGGVLFIELGPQATDPKVKLNEIYCGMADEGIENFNDVETEIANIFKDNFLVIIDDVWDAKDAAPLIKAFKNCHVVFTARRNDIAQNLTIDKSIVRIGPMKIHEAVTLLSDGLFDLDKISCDNKELLKELAQDAHMWPILLCLVRGQLKHHLKLNISVEKAIETVQHKLRDRGLTAFDKSNIESVKIYKSVSIYIESTLELLPEAALNRFITLILFTGIGGIFSEAALPSLWDSSDLEAKKVVKTLSDYGLLSFKNIFTSQYLKNQVVVHTHSVISQYMFDNIRSDQVANLSPFGMLHTNNSVSDKLESLFRDSYLQHDLSDLTPKEYLIYTMLKIEHVAIPFHLKRITAHILHDPHYILLMLQRIHNTICASVNHIQIITQVSEQIVALNSKCKKALKDAQVLNRIINSEVQHLLYIRDYDKLEKTLEEHCTTFSNGKIAYSCIELVNQIIPMCEDSVLESFIFVHQMLETLTPPHHFITMEKLPIMKLYIALHRDIVSSLSAGSTQLYKMYTYTTSGDFNKTLDSVSSSYSSKLKEIAPTVLSSSLAMFKKK